MEKPGKTYIEVPIFVCGVLHGSHKVPKNVITVRLVLFNTDTARKIRRYKHKNTELLCENERIHRLVRIEYSNEFISNPFT